MAEKKPIMRLFFAKLKEAWYEQSEEEMMEFMRKDKENLDELGCTFTTYDLRWSTEEWQLSQVVWTAVMTSPVWHVLTQSGAVVTDEVWSWIWPLKYAV